MLSLLVTVWFVALVVTSTAFAAVVAVQSVAARVSAVRRRTSTIAASPVPAADAVRAEAA